MKKFLRVSFILLAFTLALTAACDVSDSLIDQTTTEATGEATNQGGENANDITPAVSITPPATETDEEGETVETTPTAPEPPTPIPTATPLPTPDPAIAQQERVEGWAQSTSQTTPNPVLDWHDVRIASPTPEATPTPLPTPTPRQEMSPELNDKIDAVFSGELEYEPSEGLFVAALPDGYENLEHLRHKMRNDWPSNPDDMFSPVPVTADIRRELIEHSKYLLGLPYVYPRHNPYWAEGSGYSSNWIELRLSKEDGLHSHVNESDGNTWVTYAIGPDCASYIKAVYDYVLGSKLSDFVPTIYDWYRSAAPELMKDIDDSTEWIPGDLIILRDLDTSLRHIAIYLGEGKLIHSVGQSVQMSDMRDWSFRSRGNLYIAAVVAPPGVQLPEEDAKFDTTSWVITQPTPYPTYRPEGSPTPIPVVSEDEVDIPPTNQDSDIYDETTPTPTPLPEDDVIATESNDG